MDNCLFKTQPRILSHTIKNLLNESLDGRWLAILGCKGTRIITGSTSVIAKIATNELRIKHCLLDLGHSIYIIIYMYVKIII